MFDIGLVKTFYNIHWEIVILMKMMIIKIIIKRDVFIWYDRNIFNICDLLWSVYIVHRTCAVQYYISYQLDFLREKQSAF